MAHLQIIGLGFATVDVLIRLQDMPTWDRAGNVSDFTLDGGGMVGTALVAASRLGARTGYLGIAGQGELADFKTRSLSGNGVDLSRLKIRPGPERSIIICYVHQETGERLFSGLQGMIPEPLQPEELDQGYITAAEYLLLDGFHASAALQAAQWMQAAGKKVVFDGGKTKGKIPPAHQELMPYINVLICGAGYAPALTGYSDVQDAGKAALEQGPSIVVQTDGENGSYTSTADTFFHTPAFKVKVVDTTGAGDVFHGAYMVGLLRGWDLPDIAYFSTAVSAIKCTRLGGRGPIPRYPEVIEFLHKQGINIKGA
jgi:ribokinase